MGGRVDAITAYLGHRDNAASELGAPIVGHARGHHALELVSTEGILTHARAEAEAV